MRNDDLLYPVFFRLVNAIRYKCPHGRKSVLRRRDGRSANDGKANKVIRTVHGRFVHEERLIEYIIQEAVKFRCHVREWIGFQGCIGLVGIS